MNAILGLLGLTAPDAAPAPREAAPGFGELLARAVEDPAALRGPSAEAILAAVRQPDADPSRVAPELRARLQRVIARMEAEYGHEVTVVEGRRSSARQDYLYAQGRSRPGPVVTWTTESKHELGRAVDLMVDGGYTDARAYRRLQRIAREEGLHTLGPMDPGHVELPAGDTGDSGDAGDAGASGGNAAGLSAAVLAAAGMSPARPGGRLEAVDSAREMPAAPAVARPASVAPVAAPRPAAVATPAGPLVRPQRGVHAYAAAQAQTAPGEGTAAGTAAAGDTAQAGNGGDESGTRPPVGPATARSAGPASSPAARYTAAHPATAPGSQAAPAAATFDAPGRAVSDGVLAGAAAGPEAAAVLAHDRARAARATRPEAPAPARVAGAPVPQPVRTVGVPRVPRVPRTDPGAGSATDAGETTLARASAPAGGIVEKGARRDGGRRSGEDRSGADVYRSPFGPLPGDGASSSASRPVGPAAEVAAVTQADRIDAADALRERVEAQPVHRVSLRVGEGDAAARVRVDLRGTDRVRAEMATESQRLGDMLTRELPELSRALERQGLDPESMLVRRAERLAAADVAPLRMMETVRSAEGGSSARQQSDHEHGGQRPTRDGRERPREDRNKEGAE